VVFWPQGDAPAQVAQDFGLVHGLSVDGIDTVARHITQKCAGHTRATLRYFGQVVLTGVAGSGRGNS
jgi:hypothetical protein